MLSLFWTNSEVGIRVPACTFIDSSDSVGPDLCRHGTFMGASACNVRDADLNEFRHRNITMWQRELSSDAGKDSFPDYSRVRYVHSFVRVAPENLHWMRMAE